MGVIFCKKQPESPTDQNSHCPVVATHSERSHPMKLKTTLTLCAALLASSWVNALTVTPYSPDTFAKLQSSGARTALHFHADWCPTCRAQDKAMDSLKADPDLNVTVLTVDYDKEVALKKQLKVRAQSTFIIYRGTVETNRSIGETSPEGIRQALNMSR